MLQCEMSCVFFFFLGKKMRNTKRKSACKWLFLPLSTVDVILDVCLSEICRLVFVCVFFSVETAQFTIQSTCKMQLLSDAHKMLRLHAYKYESHFNIYKRNSTVLELVNSHDWFVFFFIWPVPQTLIVLHKYKFRMRTVWD